MLNKKNNNLSDRINLLGKILGNVIKEQEGEVYFKKIEKIRKLSKLSRNNNKKNNKKIFTKLKNEIKRLKPHESIVIARAFGQFLTFANIAESLNSVQKINDSVVQKSQSTNELILLEKAISKILRKKNIKNTKLYNVSNNLKIDLVLTAHPTEVKRRTLIQKYRQISDILENSNSGHMEKQVKSIESLLFDEITSIWNTDELKRTRPTPVEEAKWGLAVIEDSLWDALPKICSRFDKILIETTGKKLQINYSPIVFSSWMGGDRDGNPFVTSKITEEVILLSRWMAANLYEKELTKLIQDLSMHECSKFIKKQVGKTSEPYRVYLRPIRNKMKQTQKIIEQKINEKKPINQTELVRSISEVTDPLNEVYKSLCENKCSVIANGKILDLLKRANAFGINLAKIDIRQNSINHENLFNTLTKKMGIGSYNAWSEGKKIKFLTKIFKSKKIIISDKIFNKKEDKETWDTFKMISEVPSECLGAYVISMTRKESDILAVNILQKEARIKKPLRVVPLFETLNDLKSSGRIMENLFRLKWYLKHCNNKQEIMIGYSDSSKDAGKFAANWALYCAQEKLQLVSEKYGVSLNFFHGRGGSIGRGGGPVYAAMLSQPPGSMKGTTRITEQGEVIQQKFSTKLLAEYSLGTYIGAVLEATLIPPVKPKKTWVKLMDDMSNVSTKSYQHFLSKNKNFLKYYQYITPQKILEKTLIGSRPNKRKKNKDLKNLRAIPWVFAWTQIRFLIPAWLGTLEALELAAKGNKKLLKEMLNNWPFFYEMMDMLDMVLAKTDQRVIKYYEECLASKELKSIGNKLRKQLSSLIYLNKKLIPEKILNQRIGYRESIKVRNTYAETLNLVQADLLRKFQNSHTSKKNKKILFDAILITITGIAAAMKNTG